MTLSVRSTYCAIHVYYFILYIFNEQSQIMNNRDHQTKAFELLRQAIATLETETGIKIEIEDTETSISDLDFQADAVIAIGHYKKIYVETKRNAQQANIGAIIHQIRRLPGNAIFVADYINRKMADKLKQENIQFIDTVGNAYINLEPIYIFVTGKKQNKEPNIKYQSCGNRAFEPKGLMVTYGFLTNPELLNRPYREIARETNVALGTVAWVIKALSAGNYIHDDMKNKYRRITNYRTLLDRWVEAWPEKLKPKLFLGTFVSDEPEWWKDVKIEKYGGHWGGEIAATQYTNYLKPEIATVYIPKDKFANLVKHARLSKEPEFNHYRGSKVHLYKPFWPINDPAAQIQKNGKNIKQRIETNSFFRIKVKNGVVNPVLAYADLIATGDARNLEAAELLYEDRIARSNRKT